MITLTMTDLGNEPKTVVPMSLSEVRGILDLFNSEYTFAYIDDNGRRYKAWRFLGYRVWYSMETSLGLEQPDDTHTLEEWFRYELTLSGG